jgi:hypothetical protein
MGNSIKYTTGNTNNSLVKGNFRIGTGDVGKGPSSSTGFYKATAPPEGGYRIYLNNENVSGNIAYHTAANDSELISFTNSIAGQSYTSVTECFDYYIGQSDKVCINNEIASIPTDSLHTHYDFNQVSCRPYNPDITYYRTNNLANNSEINHAQFENMGYENFTTTNGGGIVMDGTNEFIYTVPSSVQSPVSGMTFCMWISDLTLGDVRTPFLESDAGFQYGFFRHNGGFNAVDFFVGIPGIFGRDGQPMTINTNYPVFLCLNLVDRGEGNYGAYLIMSNGNSGLIGGRAQYSSTPYVVPQNPLFPDYSLLIGRTQQNFYMNGTLNMYSAYAKSFFPKTTDIPADDTIPAEIQQYYDATKGRFGL